MLEEGWREGLAGDTPFVESWREGPSAEIPCGEGWREGLGAGTSCVEGWEEGLAAEPVCGATGGQLDLPWQRVTPYLRPNHYKGEMLPYLTVTQ